jgi:hypothetical protein
MSKPVPPLVAPGPTRRQLDELEALLQRMLELPVRQEQESTPPVSQPLELEEPTYQSFNSAPHKWEESTSEILEERDRSESPPQSTVTAQPKWGSRIDPPRFLDEHLPETDPAWDDAAGQDGEEQFSSVAGAISEAKDACSIIEAPVDCPASELLQPEPGIFRILLGWAGLVCLVLAFSILLLDWYGWTW